MGKNLRKLLKALLILATIAGAALIARIYWQDGKEVVKRQETVDKLALEILPYTEERAEWKEKDREWKKKLSAKEKGEACVLLGINNMDKKLYDTIFSQLAPYGLRATFSLKGGHLMEDPEAEEEKDKSKDKNKEKEKEYINTEQFKEMVDFGWEYAVSVEEETSGEEETEDETGEEAESQTETENQTEGEDAESETETDDFLKRLDLTIASLESQGIKRPDLVFLEDEEASDEVLAGLSERGFSMANVITAKGTPLIGKLPEKGLCRIDSALLNQDDDDLTKVLYDAASKGACLAISVNDVLRISKDSEKEINLVKFSAFLGKISTLEAEGAISVMTYSEFYDYKKQSARDLLKLQKKYEKFQEEMNQRLAEIDKEEQKIRNEVMEGGM